MNYLGQQPVRSPNEPGPDFDRLHAVRRCDILDTSPEPAFDELTFLAAQICHAPIALVAIVDETRCWFKSKLGLTFDEVQNDFALCTHTLFGHDVFAIADALDDTRFASDTLVSGDSKIRFYAGCPLVLHGYRIGTICVIDMKSRAFTEEDRQLLKDLARLAEQELALTESVSAAAL